MIWLHILFFDIVVMLSCARAKKLLCTAVENPFRLICDPWPRPPLAMTSRSQGPGSVIVEGREDKEHMFQGGSHRRWPLRFLKTNNSPREVARSVSQKYIFKQAFFSSSSFFLKRNSRGNAKSPLKISWLRKQNIHNSNHNKKKKTALKNKSPKKKTYHTSKWCIPLTLNASNKTGNDSFKIPTRTVAKNSPVRLEQT